MTSNLYASHLHILGFIHRLICCLGLVIHGCCSFRCYTAPILHSAGIDGHAREGVGCLFITTGYRSCQYQPAADDVLADVATIDAYDRGVKPPVVRAAVEVDGVEVGFETSDLIIARSLEINDPVALNQSRARSSSFLIFVFSRCRAVNSCRSCWASSRAFCCVTAISLSEIEFPHGEGGAHFQASVPVLRLCPPFLLVNGHCIIFVVGFYEVNFLAFVVGCPIRPLRLCRGELRGDHEVCSAGIMTSYHRLPLALLDWFSIDWFCRLDSSPGFDFWFVILFAMIPTLIYLIWLIEGLVSVYLNAWLFPKAHIFGKNY